MSGWLGPNTSPPQNKGIKLYAICTTVSVFVLSPEGTYSRDKLRKQIASSRHHSCACTRGYLASTAGDQNAHRFRHFFPADFSRSVPVWVPSDYFVKTRLVDW